MAEVGDRVLAFLSATRLDDGRMRVKLIGDGVFAGYEVPPADTAGIGRLMHEAGVTNSKIVIDAVGDAAPVVVWGCECWWGERGQVLGSLGVPEDRIVWERVDMVEVRARAAQAAPPESQEKTE